MTIREQDIQEFAESFALADQLTNARILVTGGTGLIGSVVTECLLALDKGISITLPVRNSEKACAMYGEKKGSLNIVECDLLRFLQEMDEDYDYIIHCASPTAGSYMTAHPVETFCMATDTTMAILEYARRKPVKSIVYVSSLEYYGEVSDDRIITEDFVGYVNHSSPRSSYPLGKQAAEYLCFAFANEYGIPAKIARLTQTFGAGVSPDDNRVFAQFARSAKNGEDIVMHTKGESAKPYCYTTDCVSAILYILLRGDNGEAYNVANKATYITIRDMAYFIRDNFSPSIDVRIEEHPKMGYAATTKLNLCTEKLEFLGWKPQLDLKEMYKRLIKGL